MIASRCCRYYVHIEHGYYICEACNLCCDPVVLPNGVAINDDIGDGFKVKKVADIA